MVMQKELINRDNWTHARNKFGVLFAQMMHAHDDVWTAELLGKREHEVERLSKIAAEKEQAFLLVLNGLIDTAGKIVSEKMKELLPE